jgi:hypothetical protein
LVVDLPLKNMSSSVGMMTFPIYGKLKKWSKPSTSCIEKEDFHGFSRFQLPFIEDFQLSRGHNGGFPHFQRRLWRCNALRRITVFWVLVLGDERGTPWLSD